MPNKKQIENKFELLIIAFTQIICKALDKIFYFLVAFFLYLAFMTDNIKIVEVLSNFLSEILKQSFLLTVSITLNVVFVFILLWIGNKNKELNKENKNLLASKRK